jgi:hypothetical protein
MKHFIPLNILEQHIAILGKTGAGKSWALRCFIELLLDEGRRVCIIDPKGDHWGIKSSADGKGAGYPLVIFGDSKVKVADAIPINARVGKEVAELVASGNRPCVIAFRGWMPTDRTRFWVDFASTLFNKNESPLWLAIDEVHNFAAQGKVLDPEAGKSLHWTNRLATEGRGLGIRILMASQRPQKVHKDTLTSAETLVAMRVIHKLDRDAYKDWIDGCGDPERGKMVMNSLAEMPRGQAFVWYPEGSYFEKMKFPQIKTFDSFKAPSGEAIDKAPRGWANVDLDEVRKRLASSIEEAKQKDPDELNRRIRELQAQLRNAPAVVVDDLAAKEWKAKYHAEKVVSDKLQDVVNRLFQFSEKLAKDASVLIKGIDLTFLSKLRHEANKLPLGEVDLMLRQAPKPILCSSKRQDRIFPEFDSRKHTEKIPRPAQRILDAIAWFESIGITDPEQTAVAFLAGYTYGGGAFYNPRGWLRTQGFVEYIGSSLIALTEQGRSIANQSFKPLRTKELHDHVLARLPGPERRILQPLLDCYPNAIRNEDLAQASGYQIGGGFNNPKGRLRSLGLIEYVRGGGVRARDLLFLPT